MGTTGIAWPVDAVASVPSYTGRMIRQAGSAALANATPARPFGAFSGVRPGTSVNTITATATTWSSGLFAGVIDLEASNLSGAYEFAFNVATSGSVTPSNVSQVRTDALAVVISDPAEGDLTAAPLVTLVYSVGTLGSTNSPAAPTRGFNVAILVFPAGTSQVPTVAWVATYVVAAGGILQATLAGSLPTSGALQGQLAEVFLDTAANNGTWRWNGTLWKRWNTDWIIYTATITGFAVGTLPVGTPQAITKYKYVGGRVKVSSVYVFGNNGTPPTSARVSLPVPATAPLDNTLGSARGYGVITHGSSAYSMLPTIYTNASTVALFYVAPSLADVSPTVPWTWASTDSMTFELEYDPA